MDIPPLPAIPQELKTAANISRNLVPFIGAGVSQIAGGPDWDKLANEALKTFCGIGKDFNNSHIEQLKTLNPRIKLSIARSLEEKHQSLIDFEKILQRTGWNEDNEGKKIYENLLKFSKKFVTTNFDEWIDNLQIPSDSGLEETEHGATPSKRKMTRIFQTDKFLPEISDYEVVHLHGSIKESKNMVMTTSQYVNHYAHDVLDNIQKNRVIIFLEWLFNNMTVLFIGYGLSELEIIEYAIQKSGKKKEKKHYLLQGFFTHERNLAEALKDYYIRECNIELIPYCRDENDWNQLSNVIEYLAREIPVGSALPVDQKRAMEDLINAAI